MEIQEARSVLMPERKSTRIFYATDVHGSELCFKKFLSASRVYEADLLILGGDITGKMIVPLIEQTDGTYRCDFAGRELVARNKEEARRIEENIRDSGYYPYYSTPKEFEELRADKTKLDKLFREIMRDNLLRWVKMAEERLNNTEKICYITGGNDDFLELDEQFHLKIAEGARLPILHAFLGQLRGFVRVATFGATRPPLVLDEVVTEHERIVDDEIWSAAQAKKRAVAGVPALQQRRPKHLLSGPLRCACCARCCW
jgi:hypothetical protein